MILACAMVSGLPVFPSAATGVVTNAGLATQHATSTGAQQFLQVSGNTVAFLANEPSQNQDLNGDGDINDDVVQVMNSATGAVTNAGLATQQPTPPGGKQFLQVSADPVAFLANEPSQNQDLNGDGDIND